MQRMLGEAERLYSPHNVPFFTCSCKIVDGKKELTFPTNWQSGELKRARDKNAVAVRGGFVADAPVSLVIVDADGDDAIATFKELARRTGVDLSAVPQVQTQRGPSGRHFYFRAVANTHSAKMRSGAKLVVDGNETNIDLRAGCNGKGVGCVLAPPTVVTGGGAYILLDGPAIHEAPPMPDALARVLKPTTRAPAKKTAKAPKRAKRDSGAHVPSQGAAQSTSNAAAEDDEELITDYASWVEIDAPRLKETALRHARARAESDNVGFPARVVREESKGVVRVEFQKNGKRVCPVSRQEHRSNNFSVLLRADERTGLAVLFVHCHSGKEGCSGGHRMLCFLDADEAEEVCAEAGIELAAAATATTLGQAAVAIGEGQKALDRLLENPNGAWANTKSLCVIACALCTAAGGHAPLVSTAALMLDSVLDATSLTEIERKTVKRALQHARVPLDPVATLRGFAAGLNGKREQDLMLVREAIVACTDPALEADVANAAESMLKALETLEYRQSDGSVMSYTDVEQGGLFVFYVWNRVARLSFDKWQTATEKKHELYLFNGATFESGQKETFVQLAYTHLKRVVEALREIAPLQSRAYKLVKHIAEMDNYFSRLTKHALGAMQNSVMLRQSGLMSPEEFHDKLDTGPYIGFANGVYDTARDVFMPRGSVGHNVLVSMTTKYDYVSPDDARVPRICADVLAYYATLFAADAADPNDELVRKARLMVGSYLYPSNYAKKLHVYLGHEGNNGKSMFAEFLRLTLGDYYVTGNLSALTPGPRETLDVEIIRNYKALICSYPEAQSSDRVSGHSTGLKLDSAKLKVMTGNDTVCARGLYQMPRNIGIKHKPIMMSNSMPELDHNDEAARGRVRVSLFGSRFIKQTNESEDSRKRVYRRIPDLNARLEEWRPFHMLLMLEWLRAFKACDMELPPGDEHTEGSYANRAVALQTPEGKLREWVEAQYSHVPLREKDSGTKLETLHTAYTTSVPPVHAKVLGKILFGKMLNAVYPNVGPHRHTTSGMLLYLLR